MQLDGGVGQIKSSYDGPNMSLSLFLFHSGFFFFPTGSDLKRLMLPLKPNIGHWVVNKQRPFIVVVHTQIHIYIHSALSGRESF